MIYLIGKYCTYNKVVAGIPFRASLTDRLAREDQNMNATKRNQKMVNVTLSLSNADYEWLEAYANVTGRTFSEAASKGISRWLNEADGWTGIEALIKAHNDGTRFTESSPANASRKAKGKKPSNRYANLIAFPSR